MKKSLTIQIPEPCHEDWAKMNPTEKGKFCQVCTKEVVDFTQATDEAIIKHFSKEGTLCGRFKASQLEREMLLQRSANNRWAQWAASLLLPLSLLTTNPSNATNDIKKTSLFNSLEIGAQWITIRGTITDSNKNSLSDVKIGVLEAKGFAFSLSRGVFTIKAKRGQTLVFSKEGFLTQNYKVQRNDNSLNIEMVVGIDSREIENHSTITTTQVTPNKTYAVGRPAVQNNRSKINKEEANKQVIVTENPIIHGTVTDNNGLPLPGVNIMEIGTQNGTQTNFDGNYALTIQKQGTLVYSYVGFETVEKSDFSAAQKYDVQMVEADDILGGMIMVGEVSYYTKEQRLAKRQQRKDKRAQRKLERQERKAAKRN